MNLPLQSQSFARLEKSEHTAQHRNDQEQRILEMKLKRVEEKEKSVKNELYKIRQEKYSQRYYSSHGPDLQQLEGALPSTKFINQGGQECRDCTREHCNSSRAAYRCSTQSASYRKHGTSADETARVRLVSARYCSELARRRENQEMEASEFESFKRDLRTRHAGGIINSIDKWNDGHPCSVRKSARLAKERQELSALRARVEETLPGKDAERIISPVSCVGAAAKVRSVHKTPLLKSGPLEKLRNLSAEEETLQQRGRHKSAHKVRFSLVRQRGAETRKASAVPTGVEAKKLKLTTTSPEKGPRKAAIKVVQENDQIVLAVPVQPGKMEHFAGELLAPAQVKSDMRANSCNRRSSWAAGTGLQLTRGFKPSEIGGKVSRGRKADPSTGERWSLTKNEEKIARQAIMRQKEIEIAADNIRKLSFQCSGAAVRDREVRDANWMPHNQAGGSWIIPLTKKINRPRVVRRHTETSVICAADFRRLLSARQKFDSSVREGGSAAVMRKGNQSEHVLDGLSEGIADCRYLRCSSQ